MRSFYTIIFIFVPLWSLCQTIRGTVNNKNHEPLAGISITVKGKQISTSTNEKGNFQIKVPGLQSVLVFTGTNVERMEIALAGRQSINIDLETKVSALDEVQVIAYGRNTARYNVGSITKVAAEDIAKQAVANPLAALQGMVPGLVVTPTNGMPGSSFKVQIRGQNTLSPNLNALAAIDNPLYIIDGVPFSPQNVNVNQFPSMISPGKGNYYNTPYAGISPFNSIDPANIESIEVLRDADATAIYGSKAGNGVILITTKKGSNGRTSFQLNMQEGISKMGKSMPMMNTQQYLQMRREAFANDGLTPNLTPGSLGYAPDLLLFDTTRYTDWRNRFLGNTAHNSNITGALSGGNNSTQFRIGAGFMRNGYIFPGGYAEKRLNFSVNLHHQSNDKKFTIDFSTLYAYSKNNCSSSESALTAFVLEPDYPELLDKNGNLVWEYKGVLLNGSSSTFNPIAYLKQKYHIENTAMNNNLVLGYQVLPNLSFKTSMGYSSFLANEYSAYPKAAQSPDYNTNTSARFGNNDLINWVVEPQLDYNLLKPKYRLDLLLGGTLQKNSNKRNEQNGYGYINDDLLGSVSGAARKDASDSYSEYKYIAFFGRANFIWGKKYILNINLRRDGSSRFGPNNRFGNFGSVGAGWIFTNEAFVKNQLGVLSYGKIRGSYGTTGSDAVADYQFLSRFAPTDYPYDGQIGYFPQNLYNPDFSWASTKKMELGLELGFLNDNLLLNAAWFRNRSGNQLVTFRLPYQTGFNNIIKNWDALVENRGIELSLNAKLLRSKDFSWDAAFNVSFPKNRLLKFPGIELSSYATAYVVGQSLSTQNKFRYASVNDSTGLFQFYGADGKLTYTPKNVSGGKLNDLSNIGNLDPKYFGGFQNSLRYKGFRLDLYFEGRKQMGLNYLAQVYSFVPGNRYNVPATFEDRWKKPGDHAGFIKTTTLYNNVAQNANQFFQQSSGVYGDASYIRLKTVSLSFEIPKNILDKFKVATIKLYATAFNVLTITGYRGNDPETQNFYGVPPLKTYTLGIQCEF
ncbi:MAG: SusC/RagA family TonB-linked outer membrane protein [Bacteroidetes bacterium]|nr:SusC/RagA family TonB-linked outer membrane protein [Bacteroidota bacterium]